MDTSALGTRFATKEDIPLLVEYIRKLAKYEKRPDYATVTPEHLNTALFGQRRVQALIATCNDKTVGYAIFYPLFSSFTGESRMYIEDVFIDEDQRGNGFGKEMMRRIGFVASAAGCTGLQWSCLDWNQPSIEFYEKLGAKQKTGVVTFSLEGDALDRLVAGE